MTATLTLRDLAVRAVHVPLHWPVLSKRGVCENLQLVLMDLQTTQGVVYASALRYPAIAGTSRASRTGRLTAAASSASNASAINIHV